MKYIQSKKIQIRSSDLHGRGVFATEFIPEKTIIEEAPYIEIPPQKISSKINDYTFSINKNNPLKALAFGFASLYNTSLQEKDSTVTYKINVEKQCIVFTTTRDIEPDEELLIYYGTTWIKIRKNFKSFMEMKTNLEK